MYLLRKSRVLVSALVACGLLASSCHADSLHGNDESSDRRDARNHGGDWPSWGGDLSNTRNYDGPGCHDISVQNVAHLASKFYVDVGAGVPASPAIVDDFMYFTDASGLLQSRDRFNGRVQWTYNVTNFLTRQMITDNGYNRLTSRSTPAVVGDFLYIGTIAGGYVIRINRHTGKHDWSTRVSKHEYALLTQSPRVYGGVLFIGIASNEEKAAGFMDDYPLSFQGAFVALDANTGDLLWSMPIVPGEKKGYAGGAVWGSEPPIDVARNRIFIATGNPYKVSDETEQCRIAQAAAGGVVSFPDPCRLADDLSESIVAIDISTGKVAWKFSQSKVEAWTIACGVNLPDLYFVIPHNNHGACPQIAGPDVDYGMAPIFVAGTKDVTPNNEDTVFTGQKSGIVWANSAKTGKLSWSTVTGNGGAAGGLMFGSATDGKHYFYAQTNSEKKNYTLADGHTVLNYGHVGSLHLRNGSIAWQKPLDCFLNAPLAHSNGLVYVSCGHVAGGSPGGQLHVYDAKTGAHLFQKLSTPGNRAGGVSIADGRVYLPTGYTDDLTSGGVFIMGV